MRGSSQLVRKLGHPPPPEKLGAVVFHPEMEKQIRIINLIRRLTVQMLFEFPSGEYPNLTAAKVAPDLYEVVSKIWQHARANCQYDTERPLSSTSFQREGDDKRTAQDFYFDIFSMSFFMFLKKCEFISSQERAMISHVMKAPLKTLEMTEVPDTVLEKIQKIIKGVLLPICGEFDTTIGSSDFFKNMGIRCNNIIRIILLEREESED